MRLLIRERRLAKHGRVSVVEHTISEPSNVAKSEIDNNARYRGALELERRLYEAAISSVDQTFAKEGLVAAFLTSGAIVAFAASLQAYAGVVSQVGRKATWTVTGLLFIALVVLVIGICRVAAVLRGWKVRDLSDAVGFLDSDPQPVTEDEVNLKLMAEYQQARKNHEELVINRLKNLLGAMWWLGIATVIAFLAILFAFISVSIHQKPRTEAAASGNTVDASSTSSNQVIVNPLDRTGSKGGSTPYNSRMAKPTEKPAPTVLPTAGSGTVMIKGGGGNGTKK